MFVALGSCAVPAVAESPIDTLKAEAGKALGRAPNAAEAALLERCNLGMPAIYPTGKNEIELVTEEKLFNEGIAKEWKDDRGMEGRPLDRRSVILHAARI